MKRKLIKKELGSIPTPIDIVKDIIRLILDSQLIKKKEYLVLDNSVGDGRFLIEYFKAYERITKNEIDLHSLFLFGLDIDSNAIKEASCKIKEMNCNISIKAGNALIGYIRPPSNYENHWSKEKLNQSYAVTFKCRNSEKLEQFSQFHWFKEWPKFLSNDGFDIIIGNPPYGISFSKTEKMLYRNIYQAFDPEIESYILFIERSIDLLCEGGLLAVIIPNNIATNYRYYNIRRFILHNVKILRIINFDKQIFPKVHVESTILFVKKESRILERRNNLVRFEMISHKNSKKKSKFLVKKVMQKDLEDNPVNMFIPQPDHIVTTILDKIKQNSIPLKELVTIYRGIELGYHSPTTSNNKINSEYVPLIAGRSIRKFRLNKEHRFIKFDSINKSVFKEKSLYLNPQKLFLRRIGHELICAFDSNQLFCVCDVYMIVPKDNMYPKQILYFEALLNSHLMAFYFKYRFSSVKKVFPKIPINFLKKLPIKLPQYPKKIFEFVEQLQNLTWNLNDADPKMIVNIQKLNKKIFDIYKMTSDEISLIERTMSNS